MAKKERKGRPPRRLTQKMRRKQPLVGKDGDGDGLFCPFCKEPHKIFVDQATPCGTFIEIFAVQPVFRGKSAVCAACGKPGGTMIRAGKQYKHDYDCTPGTTMYAEPPKYSKIAKLAYNLPQKAQRFLVRLTKRYPEQVGKLENGKITEVTGYTWKKAAR